MIVQITRTKNECFLLKEMFPLWQKFADGFVFFDDGSTDDTVEWLTANKEKYNILHIFEKGKGEKESEILKIESDERQMLFDEAHKHTNKIICLDSDEYLDGELTKDKVEALLGSYNDTVFYLHWVQYTSKDRIRVDGPWQQNFTDRMGHYIQPASFPKAQMHSLHLPRGTGGGISVPTHILYVAHLQWLDMPWVGVKQYYWKVTDWVTRHQHNVGTIGAEGYDHSVNNFAWAYAPAPLPLKIREDIFKTQDMKKNPKLEYIKKYTRMFNIPNLGDWGMGIHEYCLKD